MDHRTEDGRISTLEAWSQGHEIRCEDRHDVLNFRLTRIEKIGLSIAGTGLLALGLLLYDILIAHTVHIQ